MNLEDITVSNFASFDSEGITISKIQKINLIIGKNNSGKSNFLKFLKLLSSCEGDWRKFPLDIENQHKRNGLDPVISLKLSDIKDIYKDISNPNLYNVSSEFKEIKSKDNIEIVIDIKNMSIISSTLDILNNNFDLLVLQSQYSQAGNDVLKEAINQRLLNIVKEKLKTFDKLIYIPHFRKITDGGSTELNSKDINGVNIIPLLFQMQNPKVGKEADRSTFKEIQQFVRDLVKEPDLKIEIPHDKEKIIIEMHGNRLPLESFGTGIHELVILCSALSIYKDYIVCIEEPEIHLHPELQRKFLDFLTTTNNTYFITTHSNVFLDFKSVSISHVTYNGISTIAKHCENNILSTEILDDLGYKASDILQSNCIIWVEGPSDRIYVNNWIRKVESSLEEGLHYSIMFYGGRLLSHLSAIDEKQVEDFIMLQRLNRNMAIIIDSDKKSAQTPLNSTKKRVIKEIVNNGGYTWITEGKEIENYIEENILNNAIKKVHNQALPIAWGKYNNVTTLIIKTKQTTINKVAVAKVVINEPIDFNVLDLLQKVNELVAFIRNSN